MARPLSSTARDKMIAAATEVILERGIIGFTIDEVAKRSGVAKTTIYRHFPDTNDLILNAVHATVDYAEAPDTGSLRGDLAEFLRRILPNFTDFKSRAAHYELWAAQLRNPDLVERNRALFDSPRSAIPLLLQRWQERGEISPSIDLLTAFEIIDGPFALRSIIAPASLPNIDIDALVERMVLQLRA
jgi:AcrR family transcriptional regulator